MIKIFMFKNKIYYKKKLTTIWKDSQTKIISYVEWYIYILEEVK